MQLGIVVSSNDPEVVWNAFRLGVTALQENHAVKVFLINKGVEAEEIASEKYDVKGQMDSFAQNNGKTLACGTCLKARKKEETTACPISTMKDLLKLVEECDKIVTF